jgi:OPA family glycerol-3-phosphate transporter-like MFS transporter
LGSYLTTWNWHYRPYFLMPFALIGMLMAIKIWHDLPAATRKHLAGAG